MNKLLEQTALQRETDSYSLPVLPLRGTIVYPHMVVPLMIQQPEQARLIDDALNQGSRIGLFVQKDQKIDQPIPEDLYEIGTAGNILKMLRFPDGTVRSLVQGLGRIRIIRFTSTPSPLAAEVTELDEHVEESLRMTALQRNLIERVKILVELAPYLNEEFHVSAINQDTPSKLVDFVASSLNISLRQKQQLLEQLDVYKRMQSLYQAINKEIEVLELSQKIHAQAASELDKSQRDYILREQLKAIRRELGEGDDSRDVEEFQKKIASAKMPATVQTAALKEVERLSHMNSSSAEYTVSRTYLDWLVVLPWSVSTVDILDLKKAKKILDTDHFDLEKVKERILEYLAVRKLKSNIKGPILCFVGPPGVGKTSLGKSIAKAMDRQFARISLGGMRDEAEIRGHRRTYIGALPGRVIQSLKRCGSNNPVIMLDEIDKLGSDFRGDPASALLEVLDPEQNDTFNDHYLDLPFDLSKVMFITTANWAEPIPHVLRDRMELIQIPGYTEIEKISIARRHLIPKQLENHGLNEKHLEITNDGLVAIIESYTREAGVRNLEREIASTIRKVARRVATGSKKKVRIDGKTVHRLLGPRKFTHEVLTRHGRPGVVPGLAYTAAGGEILFVEATIVRGKSALTLTGQLGSVMKESAQAALSFIRANAEALDIDQSKFEHAEIHIHVPAGATPKDGPSAGITIAAALASIFSQRPVKAAYAMTGEVTLRGELLPIGGIKEKLLAAARAGVTHVVLPAENKKELVELPHEVRKKLKIKFFSDVLPAVKFVLEGAPKKKPVRRLSSSQTRQPKEKTK